ncbi:MAG: methyl-accepting chemotaxis protein [Phycisphaerae bacterium]|nr:methyl-accepting chemotaxis protein [Phycisphaerae bacterium]
MNVPFRHSLTGRLLVLGVLPMVLLIVAIVAIGMTEKYRTLKSVGETRILQALQYARSVGEDRMNDASRTARIIAEAEAAGVVDDSTATRAFLSQVVARDPAISAVWVARDARGGKDSRAFAIRVAHSAAGGTPRVVDDATLTSGAAYLAARRSGESAEPIAVGGEVAVRDGERFLDVAFPIIVGGRFVGAAGAEYSLDGPANSAAAVARDENVRIFFISPGGTIIAGGSHDSFDAAALAGTLVRDTSLASVLGPIVAAANKDARLELVTDPVSGRATYAASGTTRTLGARIVLMKPVDEITAPIVMETVRNALVAGAGLVVLTALIVWLSVSVSRRLGNAVSVATAIAAGDLSARATSTAGRDESALLLGSLDVMAERLGLLVGAVHAASATVDRGVHELVRVTEGQRRAALPLGQTTAEVAAAARQISTTSEELAGTMRSLEASAMSTSELAGRTRENLASVDGSMRDLDGATESVAERLAAINERAAAINGVVTTITKVADQTNILSVNAAIEAEKAGEQGRGFLVVAREIRRLADQTGGATLEIERMVQDMQSAVSAGVMEMDRFSEKVRRSVDEVARSSGRMAEIISQVGENAVRFRAVTDGMASQSAGAVQISDATAQLRESARSTVDGVTRIAATVRALEDASESLRSSVAAFGLDGAACSLELKHVEPAQDPVN